MNMIKYIKDHIRWSKKTFGEGQRTIKILRHINNELDEVALNPGDVTNWADIIILAIDGAWRAGHKPGDIVYALIKKQQANRERWSEESASASS